MSRANSRKSGPASAAPPFAPPNEGGSYVIEGGQRRLIARTGHTPPPAPAEPRSAPAPGDDQETSQ